MTRADTTAAQPHVILEPRGLSPVELTPKAPLEQQLAYALQIAIGRVSSEYTNQSVDQVYETLLAETRSGLRADVVEDFHPDVAELRRVAEAIVQGRPPA